MINILIVDDSLTELALLESILEAEPDFKVIGTAKNGNEAIQMVASLKPDIITMDILMPVMNGFEATRYIMSQCPVPIVIISSAVNDESLAITFEALESGALAVLEKPHLENDTLRKRIVDTVRSMAEIHVIKRRFFIQKDKTPLKHKINISTTPAAYEIVAIGTSVGGPQTLKTILSALPHDFPLPIVIVQHMTSGFIHGFSNWLNNHIKLVSKCAENNEVLKAGTIYFAPDSCHLKIERKNNQLISKLVETPPVSGFRPSATVLFQSIAETSGSKGIGIILTGMGQDGARGLLELKNAKGHTFIQDEESAVVFGMAGVAQKMGAVDKVVELDQIADYLISITRHIKSK